MSTTPVTPIKLFNFSHPLTDANIEEINSLLCNVEEAFPDFPGFQFHLSRGDIVNIPVQVSAAGLVDQMSALIPAQNVPVGLVRLPGLADAAYVIGTLMAQEGQMYQVRLAVLSGSTPTHYQVVELIDMNEI